MSPEEQDKLLTKLQNCDVVVLTQTAYDKMKSVMTADDDLPNHIYGFPIEVVKTYADGVARTFQLKDLRRRPVFLYQAEDKT